MKCGHWQLLGKKGCKGCYKLLNIAPSLYFENTHVRGNLRLNQDSEALDVAVIIVYFLEILLMILVWRIIKILSGVSH